jgi:hypothetical protein
MLPGCVLTWCVGTTNPRWDESAREYQYYALDLDAGHCRSSIRNTRPSIPARTSSIAHVRGAGELVYLDVEIFVILSA